MKKYISTLCHLSIYCMTFILLQGCAKTDSDAIVLRTMGSFMFGGTVNSADNGDTFHGDHGYAQYYIPQKSRNYPIVMWHGIGQSGKTWESTADGREGYQAILPRRGWSIYIIDQPRRGRAGHTLSKNDDALLVPTTSNESAAWDAFRLGVWVPPADAEVFTDMQFPIDPISIDQFFRWQTPDTGAEPRTAEHRKFMGQTVGELFKQTGEGILITHSNSGQYGWATAMEAPELIKGIIAYEPGAFSFPEGERPDDVPAQNLQARDILAPQMVPMDEFLKLTKMPILIVYGDNIASELSDVFNVEVWRIASTRAKQFAEAVNRHGGDAQVVFLPKLGMKGNTHVPFADKNILEVADQLSNWLHSKGLDVDNTPHKGPNSKKITEYTIPLKN